MNFKTTAILVVLLAALGITVWMLNQTDTQRSSVETDANASIEKPLLPDDFGDVREVTLQHRDGKTISFHLVKGAESKDDKWEVSGSSPLPAAKHVIDGIIRRIKGAKVQLTYKKGDAGAPTLAEADLDPTRESITLKNDAGKTARVDIGRSPDDSRTYVRLDGGDDVLAVTPGLKDLLKKKETDYRDLVLFSFDKSKAFRIEVSDQEAEGGPTRLVLIKTGNQWNFVEPFEAAANQKKINDLVAAMSNLRVAGWVEGTKADARVYGLDPPPVTVSVLVAEEASDSTPPGEPENADTAEPPVEGDAAKGSEKTRTYTLHVSRRAPLGEDAKLYIQPADQDAYATVMKSTADKLMPRGSDWRELKLFSTPLAGAERLTITNGSGTATLEKADGGWRFANSQAVADDASVRDTLNKLSSLEALGFVNDPGSDSQAHGFQNPQARVEVKLPGRDEPEVLEIGDYTDAQARRLVFARRANAPGVAKLRVDDVALLLGPASSFQNRTIADIAADRITGIDISGRHLVTREPYHVTLTRQDGQLVITDPPGTPTDTAKAEALAASFLKLQAAEVLPADTAPDAVGLDQPEATVTIKYEGLDPSPEPTIEAQEPERAVESMTLALSRNDGKVYVKREGSETIYRADPALMDQLQSELRTTDLFTFDEKAVASVNIATASGAVSFEKRDNKWTYVNEPLLPMDGKKVDSLVAQIKALKPTRFAAYAADPAAYGLDSATRAMSITVKTKDDLTQTLHLSDKGPQGEGEKRIYAVLDGSKDVALLPGDTLNRFALNIADYEASSKDTAAKPPMPPTSP